MTPTENIDVVTFTVEMKVGQGAFGPLPDSLHAAILKQPEVLSVHCLAQYNCPITIEDLITRWKETCSQADPFAGDSNVPAQVRKSHAKGVKEQEDRMTNLDPQWRDKA